MDVVGHYARFLFSAGLVLLAALGAFRDAPADGMPAGRVLAALANVPDRQRCDGFPQPVIQGKHPVVAVPVFSRRRHKVRHTIKELKRRQLDYAGRKAGGASPAGAAAAGMNTPSVTHACRCTW